MMLVTNTKNEPIGRVDANQVNGKTVWEATAMIWGTDAMKHLGMFQTIDEAIKEVKKNGRKKLQAYYAAV